MCGAAIDRRSSLHTGPSVHFFSGITRLTIAWSITRCVGSASSIRTPCGPGVRLLDDQWLAARIHPMPGSVIHCEVEMSDPRRHIERPGPEHRQDAQIFGPILNDDQPAGERIRSKGVNE